MDAIAAAAGVSKNTLYDRYPNKEVLLRAIVAERVTQWSQTWLPDDEPMSANLEQRLKRWAHKFMEYCRSDEVAFVERLFASGPSMSELQHTRYEIGHRRIVQLVAQDIVEATDDQPVPRGTAVRVAETLIAMIYGWARAQQGGRVVTREEALDYADYAVEVLLRGRSAWTA